MFDDDRDRKLEELFQLGADLDISEREAFFVRHCGTDAELRTELEELLRQDEEGTKDFLQSPVLTSRQTSTGEEEELPSPGKSFMPERIGRYRIIERVGEGGMGSVYLAEQEHPVRRRVALKIVKAGMDTERVIQRFEMERQALALMDHPGIARIFDGGATDTGRPYFAMEFAPGISITRFCDSENLSMRDRLLLFIQVCEAVQHAHHKGIIHRDIKPTNVLVSRRDDGRIVPKVIDFGIARATSESSEERRQSTRASEVVGTAYYMSPEQADPEGVNVDTRTDVYALGVMLYELLTGVLPFDSDTFRGKTAAEVQTILRDVDPAHPSARVAGLGASTTTVAERRGVARHALVSHLAGDLDWITMRAMEKDPQHRYSSAAGLVADIRNHLEDRTLMAGPPDMAYRVKKFIRRNRIKVVSGALILLAMIAGIIGTTWGMLESSRTRDEALVAKARAETAERESDMLRIEADSQRQAAEDKRDEALASKAAAQAAEKEAERQRGMADAAQLAEASLRSSAENEAKQSQDITRFLVKTLSLADSGASVNPQPSLETMLVSASERVENAFQESPAGEATVRKVLGEAMHSLGHLEVAETHLRRALEIQRGLIGTENSEIYETMARLARVYTESDSRNAFELFQRSCKVGAKVIGQYHHSLEPYLEDLIEHVSEIDVHHSARLFEFVVENLPDHLPANDEHWLIVADIFEFLGHSLGYQWGAVEGVRFLEEALVIRRRELPVAHPKIANVLNLLVNVLNSQGEYSYANDLIHESLLIYEAAFPSDHWLLSETRSLLGECQSGQGYVVAAEDYLLPSHKVIVAARGNVSRAGLDSISRLIKHFENSMRPALADQYRGELAQAFAFSRNAPSHWDKQAAAFLPEHRDLIVAIEKLDALVLQDTHSTANHIPFHAELGEAMAQVIELRHKLLEHDDPLSVIIARLLSEYVGTESHEIFEIDQFVSEEVLLVLNPHRERLPQPVATALKFLGRNALALDNDPARAEGYFGQAWELQHRAFGFSDEETLETLQSLIVTLVEQGRFTVAEARLIRTWEECMALFGPRHESTDSVLGYLSRLYLDWDRPTMLETYLEKHLRVDFSDDQGAFRLDRWARLAVRTDGFSDRLYDLAKSASERAIEVGGPHPLFESTIGKALYRLRRPEEARVLLIRANERSPRERPDNLAVLAMIHSQLGEEDELHNVYERLLRFESEVGRADFTDEANIEIDLYVTEAEKTFRNP
ncbi:MAG: serine/threonine protein kinase [Planctomycetota bacterium]